MIVTPLWSQQQQQQFITVKQHHQQTSKSHDRPADVSVRMRWGKAANKWLAHFNADCRVMRSEHFICVWLFAIFHYFSTCNRRSNKSLIFHKISLFSSCDSSPIKTPRNVKQKWKRKWHDQKCGGQKKWPPVFAPHITRSFQSQPQSQLQQGGARANCQLQTLSFQCIFLFILCLLFFMECFFFVSFSKFPCAAPATVSWRVVTGSKAKGFKNNSKA